MPSNRHLMLLRHAKSSWDDTGLADIDRPLSGRGRHAADAMGAYLADRGYDPDLILCSAARRTRETLGRVVPYLAGDRDIRIRRDIYRVDNAGILLDLIQVEGGQASSVMVIGHNPVLEDLTMALVGRDSAGRLDAARGKFPTGGLAVIGVTLNDWSELGQGDGDLLDFTVPRELEEA